MGVATAIFEGWFSNKKRLAGYESRTLVRDSDDPTVVDLAKYKLVCHTELGVHLKSYRAA
jgi:hypothetical protein